ncbi:sensor histidine kinase [Vibrio cincinnatiensis]|uniref:HAMP domain-containing sensor histidine kinase n=1 Tax=Vibrio cincinnatiensis TaxID=675 RepID=UPI001EDF21BB|nr:sensor histidine kinase [Vibrio cincinnatiensis]MCG3758156.1 sensor histidine kinase [Vibrio cincinnatiensis]MCG3761452.1 sensor histidine kinase [Vibrio cincinnatiensis]
MLNRITAFFRQCIALQKRLVIRLFASLALSVLLVLTAFTAVEMLLLDHFLTLPKALQTELRLLAEQAKQQLAHEDRQALAQWERSAPYLVHVVNDRLQPLSERNIHPHVLQKMRYSRQWDEPMGAKVSKPMIRLPLTDHELLMVQLPWQQHPASRAGYYLWFANLIVTMPILALISWILSRQLQRPLTRLQSASRALALGETEARVANTLGRTAQEFQELATDFDQMAEQIQQLVDEQRKLVRTLSHELKTPLTRQSLDLHLAQQANNEEDRHEWLDRAGQEAELMDSMIEKILALSRLEGCRLPVTLIPMDVNAYLTEQVEQFRPHLKPQQQLHFFASMESGWILADRVLLGSAVNNVLTNAVKYAGERGVINMRVDVRPTQLLISVADNGQGVSDDDLEHLFKPFYQVKKTPTQCSGYGLGLSIVKQSVHKMNGRVCAKNEQGLVIDFTFPRYDGLNKVP